MIVDLMYESLYTKYFSLTARLVWIKIICSLWYKIDVVFVLITIFLFSSRLIIYNFEEFWIYCWVCWDFASHLSQRYKESCSTFWFVKLVDLNCFSPFVFIYLFRSQGSSSVAPSLVNYLELEHGGFVLLF